MICRLVLIAASWVYGSIRGIDINITNMINSSGFRIFLPSWYRRYTSQAKRIKVAIYAPIPTFINNSVTLFAR